MLKEQTFRLSVLEHPPADGINAIAAAPGNHERQWKDLNHPYREITGPLPVLSRWSP
ncbi:hypothetical protein SBA4_1090004 [Candidatus Sulfopaludibacter sp. SbA4]|nr:hypothetical protein SBA4_1090004 [Candidatus Sulfopaludibacter sp. SbA4]